jgi:cephalosporin hydroxylase
MQFLSYIPRRIARFSTKNLLRLTGAVEEFHALYYRQASRTWQNTFWIGTPIWKFPLDLWVYQEICTEIRPDVIIESGTYKGGSALFLAHVCDALGKGAVVSIDIESRPDRPQHPRITYIHGPSTSSLVVKEMQNIAHNASVVLVILDSDHSKDHVLREMELFAPLVTVGSYLIVEDTNLNGHPVVPEFGPGPMEAVREFLQKNHDFAVDSSREKFFLTTNPSGYLKRVR